MTGNAASVRAHCDTCKTPLRDGDDAYLHEREEERRIDVRGETVKILDVVRTYLLCVTCEKKSYR